MELKDIKYIMADKSKMKLTVRIADTSLIIDMLITEFMEGLCLQQGTTLQGRIDAMRRTLNIRQKPPFYVTEELFLFPLNGMKNIETILLNFAQIKSVRKSRYYNCRIRFWDDEILELQFDYRTIARQINRCHQYLKFLQSSDDIGFIQKRKMII